MRRHDAWSDLHDAGHRRPRTAPAVPRLSLGALAAPQLARRSSRSVHAAAVLDAQHRYGNKRVGRVLSRDATAVRHRPGHPPKLPLKSGQEIDALFDANAFLQQVIASKLGKKYVQKAMKIDSGQAFERAWVAYAKRSFNPVTGKNYTEDEAREYLK